VESLKIALVNYYNTYPMLYGLEHDVRLLTLFPDIKIYKTPPADCATLYNNGAVEVALVPVGALSTLQPHQIITDYCIGCDGEVRTVCLFSNQPIDKLESVILDDHSRTSALLIQVILSHLAKNKIAFNRQTIGSAPLPLNTGVLMIGDKVFEHEKKFKYCLDLGAAWKNMTGLPFVFATWVAKPEIPQKSIDAINQALAFGIQNIPKVIAANPVSHIDLTSYFLNYIKYDLDDKKREALELFLRKSSQFQ